MNPLIYSDLVTERFYAKTEKIVIADKVHISGINELGCQEDMAYYNSYNITLTGQK